MFAILHFLTLPKENGIFQIRIFLISILILCHLAPSNILMPEIAFKAPCLLCVAIFRKFNSFWVCFSWCFHCILCHYFSLIMCPFCLSLKICSLALTCFYLNTRCFYLCVTLCNGNCAFSWVLQPWNHAYPGFKKIFLNFFK